MRRRRLGARSAMEHFPSKVLPDIALLNKPSLPSTSGPLENSPKSSPIAGRAYSKPVTYGMSRPKPSPKRRACQGFGQCFGSKAPTHTSLPAYVYKVFM